MTPIEKLALIGIPTRSAPAAIQYLRDKGYTDKLPEDYKYLIAHVSGAEAPSEDERELNYTFRYMVQEAIRNHDLRGRVLVASAYVLAKKFIAENAYVFAKPEAEAGEPKLDATGKPKPKKGAKKEMAIKVYNEKIKDKDLSRKEAIQILMDEVGMSAGGASTYYANLKKGTL